MTEPIEPPRPATRVERGEELVKALEWAVRRVTGRRPVFGGVPGSTDGTILRTVLGIPIVTFGPGNRFIPHQVDERVPVTELVEAARAYAAAALRYLVSCLSRRRILGSARWRRFPRVSRTAT